MKRSAAICALVAAGLMIAPCVLAEETACSDPAKTIEVELCREFTITLESNKTTGFGWDIAVPLDEKIVKFISCEYIPADASLAGSGGREMWTFRALSPGKAAISFKYVRPWEKGVPPAKEMAFTVCAKEAPAEQGKQEERCSDRR